MSTFLLILCVPTNEKTFYMMYRSENFGANLCRLSGLDLQEIEVKNIYFCTAIAIKIFLMKIKSTFFH
jgi:hypothetical protein